MISAHLTGDKITSLSEEAFSIYDKSSFGEKINNRIIYSPVEALFLIQEGRMQVFSGKKIVQPEKLSKKLSRHDKKIDTKLAVYSDLKKRGYIVKSALKFGAEFRVYNKGVKPGADHAKWILYTVKDSDNINWHDFSAKNRVAHSTKKNLLIAVVDDEMEVSYYEVSWLKP